MHDTLPLDPPTLADAALARVAAGLDRLESLVRSRMK